MRTLIVDFDFFSARGGGQTFYRRVVERHPRAQILYPSRGPDLRRRKELPSNATPFPFDRPARAPEILEALRDAGWTGIAVAHADTLCAIGRALQGESFDAVEVPSFHPCAHLVRPVFAAHGIRVGRICLGLLGWLSVSVGKAGPTAIEARDLEALDALETASVAAADTCYTISSLHAAENALHDASPGIVDMHDALEAFLPPPLEPPGDGPPDLWYVGRLDPAKAPDLFLEIVARLPSRLYRHIMLTGPDSTWMPPGQRWSDAVRKHAAALGLEVTYLVDMSDAELRAKAYGGRSVVVIPSRTDAFNLVALEALVHGAPVLLSRHAGAADFLLRHHPEIAPPVIEPEDTEGAATALAELLSDYPARFAALRTALHAHPLPRPREDFLEPFWSGPQSRSSAAPDSGLFTCLKAAATLGSRFASVWRPRHWPRGGTTAVVVVRDALEALRATIAALARQKECLGEILILDDGSHEPVPFDYSTEGIRVIRQGRRGLAAALNRGCGEAKNDVVLLFLAGDLPRADCALAARAADARQPAEGTCAIVMPWAWQEPGGLAPCTAEAPPGWSAPGLLCRPRGLLAAGGFAASADGDSVLPPSGWHLLAAPHPEPLVWRPRDAALPWWRQANENGGDAR